MTIRHRVRAFAYRVAYSIPARWRRRIVRVVMPKFIIGSVVLVREAVTDNDAGRLLLIRQPPGYGWSVPGGLFDRGEVPIETAARELREEVGIALTPDELTPMNPNAIVHTNGRWIDCVFEARVPVDTPLRPDGAEVLEVGWFRLDALPPLTLPTARLLARYGIGPYVDYPEALP